MRRVEGLSLKAYLDHGGRGWVCGRGHSNGAGPPLVTQDTVWTEEYAEEVFLADVARSVEEVKRIIKTPLTPMQLGACASINMNRGVTKFKKSATVAYINDPSETNHMIKAAAAMLNHVTSIDKNTGQEREFLGLKARRIREAAYFLHDWPPA